MYYGTSKFETSLIEIIDKHIPIKKRKPVAYPVPYMNQNLRNASIRKRCTIINFLNKKLIKIGKHTENQNSQTVDHLKKNYD
jgi:hypothetical protein